MSVEFSALPADPAIFADADVVTVGTKPKDSIARSIAKTSTQEGVDVVSDFGITWWITEALQYAIEMGGVASVAAVTVRLITNTAFENIASRIPFGRDKSGKAENAAHDSKTRSFVKAVVGRIPGAVGSFAASGLLTWDMTYAGKIALYTAAAKLVIVYINDRAWTRSTWGTSLVEVTERAPANPMQERGLQALLHQPVNTALKQG